MTEYDQNMSYLSMTLILLSAPCRKDLHTPSVDKIVRLLKTDGGPLEVRHIAVSFGLDRRSCQHAWPDSAGLSSTNVRVLRLRPLTTDLIFDDHANYALLAVGLLRDVSSLQITAELRTDIVVYLYPNPDESLVYLLGPAGFEGLQHGTRL